MYRLFYKEEKIFETKNELQFYYFITNHCRGTLHLDLEFVEMEMKNDVTAIFYFNKNKNEYYVIDQTFHDPSYVTNVIEYLKKELSYFLKNNY
jgi:hypothetical protein